MVNQWFTEQTFLGAQKHFCVRVVSKVKGSKICNMLRRILNTKNFTNFTESLFYRLLPQVLPSLTTPLLLLTTHCNTKPPEANTTMQAPSSSQCIKSPPLIPPKKFSFPLNLFLRHPLHSVQDDLLNVRFPRPLADKDDLQQSVILDLQNVS